MSVLPDIPTLETERLILRPLTMDDYPVFEALMCSERAKYMGGPFDRQGSWGAFCHGMAGWSLFGMGALFIAREGETIGEVGLNNGPLFPETELGWSLFAGHEGQGYATEAATALRDWAYSKASVSTLVSYTHPENKASQAVARRMGAVVDPDAPRQDPEDVVLRHRRPQ